MKIDILSLFPEMFEGFLNTSIIKRAIESDLISINIVNFRDYSTLNHAQVDDTPYGGGGGMVLRVEPIYNALEQIRTEDSFVIMMTPQGVPYKQQLAIDLSRKSHIIILCGHYEGFDERIRSFVDLEVSIGDYVLTGGEIPAMAICDSVARLIPGVIKTYSSHNDSFTENLLDYPTYTKPAEFNGMKVPEVLLSGNHQSIIKWRKEMQLENTKKKRNDLLK